MQSSTQSDRQATRKELCEALSLLSLDAPGLAELATTSKSAYIPVSASGRLPRKWSLALAREAQDCGTFN
jgi:hypothetical protein